MSCSQWPTEPTKHLQVSQSLIGLGLCTLSRMYPVLEAHLSYTQNPCSSTQLHDVPMGLHLFLLGLQVVVWPMLCVPPGCGHGSGKGSQVFSSFSYFSRLPPRWVLLARHSNGVSLSFKCLLLPEFKHKWPVSSSCCLTNLSLFSVSAYFWLPILCPG